MKNSLHDILIKAFVECDRSFYGKRGNIYGFKEWKRELRNHDVTCDVVNLLDGIPQSTFYHPEYDALLHTFYVCRAVMAMNRDDLLETAFLHDVGKAFTTNIGDKRIYHFGHPDASVEFIDKIKYKLKDYEKVRKLTHTHMNKPKDKDEDDFNYADKELSKELYKLNHSIIDRWLNKVKEWNVHRKQRYSKKKIIIPVGISGSGKSTYFMKKILRGKISSNMIVSPDAIRRELTGNVSDMSQDKEVWATTFVRLRVAIEKYGLAVLDATNTTKFLRVRTLAPFNDCRKEAIVFECDPEVAISRVNTDLKLNVDRSAVPPEVIRKQFKNLNKGLNSLKYEFNKVKRIWS